MKQTSTIATSLIIVALGCTIGRAFGWQAYDLPPPTTHHDSRAFNFIQGNSMPAIFGNFQHYPNHLLIPSNGNNPSHQVINSPQEHRPAHYTSNSDLSTAAASQLAAAAAFASASTTSTTTTTPRPPNVELNDEAPKSDKTGSYGEHNSRVASSSIALDLAKSLASAVIDARTASGETAANDSSASSSSFASSSSMSNPSPVGKILSAAVQAAGESLPSSSSNSTSKTSTNASSTTNTSSGDKLNIAFQLLKPRKFPTATNNHESSKSSAAAIEQQIINQHARLHPASANHHQHLTPTKHRDTKLVNAILGNSNSPSTTLLKDLPLYGMLFGLNGDSLDGFKSGISSRSSIVKAISDNKLARTITTVGKSVSGNKYVAGVAAASALAALGVTLSKLLSPYLFAGSYSKLGDPMLGSASFLTPSLSNYMSTDRNYFYSGAGSEPLLSSGSTLSSSGSSSSGPSMLRMPQQFGSSFSNSYSFPAEYPASFSDQSGSSAFSQAGYYPTTSSGAFYPPQSVTEQPQVYVTYNPVRGASKIAPSRQSESFGTSGHYSDFYNQHGSGESDASGAGPYLQSSGTMEQPTYTRYTPQLHSTQTTLVDSSNLEPQTFSPQSSASNLQQQQQQASTNFEQIYPESSQTSYVQQPQLRQYGMPTGNSNVNANILPTPRPASQVVSQWQAPYSSSNGRRSGAVALKMDEATRAKLYQHLQERLMQQQQQQQSSSLSMQPMTGSGDAVVVVGASSGRNSQVSGSNGGGFVPMTTAADSSGDYAFALANSNSKSARVELTNGFGADHHAPAASSKSQQQGHQLQQQELTSINNHHQQQQQATHLFIRPNIANDKRQTVSEVTNVNVPKANSNKLDQSASSMVNSNSWRSLDNGSRHRLNAWNLMQSLSPIKQQQQQATATANHNDIQSTPSNSGDQISTADQAAVVGNNNDNNNNNNQPSTTNDVSSQPSNFEGHLLQRVSRTPSSSLSSTPQTRPSVKGSSLSLSSSMNADYESEPLTNGAKSSAKASVENQQVDSSSSPPSRTELTFDRTSDGIFKLSTGRESNSRLNFVQLDSSSSSNSNNDDTDDTNGYDDDSDKNNVIKVIEANSVINGDSNKLTVSRSSTAHYGVGSKPTVLILPKTRPQVAKASSSGSGNAGRHTNNGQPSVTITATATAAESSSNGHNNQSSVTAKSDEDSELTAQMRSPSSSSSSSSSS